MTITARGVSEDASFVINLSSEQPYFRKDLTHTIPRYNVSITTEVVSMENGIKLIKGTIHLTDSPAGNEEFIKARL